MAQFQPSYIKAFQNGLLSKRITEVKRVLSNCTLCPRKCKVNRLNGQTGICNTADKAFVASAQPHFGEEPELVGFNGSGTIFFTHCNLMCNFCQNYDISHEGAGKEVSDTELANLMLYLQNAGCHNINFVTPSHVVPQILSALPIAIEKGLNIPLVYNSNAYDTVETIRLLEGIFDIFMPDFKFLDSSLSSITCKAPDYPQVAKPAIKEMYRIVGNLQTNKHKIAEKGLIIRHLVMPNQLYDTKQILEYIGKEISPKSYVNIMPQYRPCGTVYEIKELFRKITLDEFNEALKYAKEAGLNYS
jgi:putative pyruvate formate lyase activating enzyme